MYIGKPLRRDEDFRFLTGHGRYTDDIDVAEAAHAVFVRSPHGHARILGVSTEQARQMPGVLCVLTAEDWEGHGLGRWLPAMMSVDFDDGRPMNNAPWPILALDEVHHVGDPVAAVVAQTHYQAVEAAEAVEVRYESLPAVTDVARAAAADSPVLHHAFGSNVVFEVESGDARAAASALEGAHHVTELRICNTRVTATAIEPRAYLGRYDPAHERYTLWASTQVPQLLRSWICKFVLDRPLTKVRVVAPDVGGGFGMKAYFYPEQPVVLLAARLTGRPVRFTATRSESFVTDTHARDFLSRARMGFDENGRMLCIDVHALAGFGAYQSTFNSLIAGQRLGHLITGVYRIPVAHVKVTGVYANTLPTDAYRGVGQSQVTIRERLVENAALELGIDPADLRRMNYIDAGDYPYTTVFGTTYDSGDPAGQHAMLLEQCDYDALRGEQRRKRSQGERLGIGLAAFADHSGMGPSRAMKGTGADFGTWEAGRVQIHADGRATASVGTHSHGQGHDITFRQVVADTLGIDIAHIELLQGDTDRDAGNFGTGAMRSLITGGMALLEASRRVVAKSKRLAAHLLEAAPEDVDYERGSFTIPGTDREISFTKVARMANTGADYPEEGFDLGLDETVYFDPVADTFPTGVHLAVVRVDVETGAVALRDYYAVDDCGRVVNPLIVDGQI